MVMRALAREEVGRVSRAEVVGRIGCHASGRTYIVPVCYAFDRGAVYAHSGLGLKIAMMPENPSVCFEVDHVEDLANWDNAICWARYEELSRDDAQYGLKLIRGRIRERMPRTPLEEIAASLAYRGAEPDMARRIVEFLVESHDAGEPKSLSPKASTAHSTISEFIPEDVRAEPGFSDLDESCSETPPEAFSIPDDVLAERDAAARARTTVRGDDASALALLDSREGM